jgi:hypothetical protein
MDGGSAKASTEHDASSQPSSVLRGKKDENIFPVAPPTRIMHPHIEKALSLIEEAHVLEEAACAHQSEQTPENHASSSGVLQQQAAAKYNEAVSHMKSYVEKLDRQKSRESTNANNSLVGWLGEKIKKYEMKACELNDLAKGVAFPLVKEARVSEEAASAEPRPRPPTGDDENHASTRGALHQESAVKCHDAVSYMKSYRKQLDRQRESYEFTDSENSVTREGQDEDKEEQDDDEDDDDEFTSVHIIGAPEEKQRSGSRNLAKKVPAKKKAPAKKKKKDTMKKAAKKPMRTIDLSHPIEYTEHDVLYGRGGNANTHPGNIRFREKVRELLPRYLECSKTDKFHVSVELIESVTSEGHLFLEKGPGGKWYKVVGDTPRKKASQAFRDSLADKNKKEMSEQRSTVSLSPVTVGGRDIDPISMASEEWNNDVNINPDFFEFVDEPSNYQRNPHHPRRVIDLSCPIEHTKHDVLFGRGGDINFHPGNVRFREKARDLLPKYLKCSKDDKTQVSVELMESVTSAGHRFLDKGPHGKWYMVVGNAPRKKASQAFRDALREVLKDVCSTSKDWGQLFMDVLEDVDPTSEDWDFLDSLYNHFQSEDGEEMCDLISNSVPR